MALGPDEDEITLVGLSAFAGNVIQNDTPIPPRLKSATKISAIGPVQIGTQVANRYEIETALGSGGMGQVFRVRHLGLGKKFALKLLHRDLSIDDDSRVQFYREARVASALAHPNIVSVVDFGEDEKLGAFMIMELVDGDKLSTHLRKEIRLAQKPWCDLMLQLAEAVHHIHQHNIVHGDIKPDNLILCPVPSTDRRKSFMKLLDFGLARRSTVGGPIKSSVAGTPQYISPERLRGESPQPSMDIYAVGVVGYELLCGRPPFDGAISDVIGAHLDKPPPPFAKHGVTNVDERAEALIMRALSKSPEDRQANMAAFLYELRTLMAMLGMGRRRAVTTPRPNKRDNQDRARGRLFELTPIPLAGVDVSGRIVIANQAFAKFVTGNPNSETAGVSVAATRLTEVFPDIMAELRQVHISGKGAKRVIHLRSSKGKSRASKGDSIDLLVWMMPGAESTGDVTLAIHPLPR